MEVMQQNLSLFILINFTVPDPDPDHLPDILESSLDFGHLI